MVLECMVAGTSFRKLDKVEAELLSTVPPLAQVFPPKVQVFLENAHGITYVF